MPATIESFAAKALQLSSSERALLIERLIANIGTDPDGDDAWFTEVERRNAEIESGAVSLIPGPETLAKLRAEFQ